MKKIITQNWFSSRINPRKVLFAIALGMSVQTIFAMEMEDPCAGRHVQELAAAPMFPEEYLDAAYDAALHAGLWSLAADLEKASLDPSRNPYDESIAPAVKARYEAMLALSGERLVKKLERDFLTSEFPPEYRSKYVPSSGQILELLKQHDATFDENEFTDELYNVFVTSYTGMILRIQSNFSQALDYLFPAVCLDEQHLKLLTALVVEESTYNTETPRDLSTGLPEKLLRNKLGWCGCEDAPVAAQCAQLINILDHVNKSFATDEPLIIASFGSGKLKFELLLSKLLNNQGYANVTIVGIDPCYEQGANCFFGVIDDVPAEFSRLTPSSVSLVTFASSDQYLQAIQNNEQKRPHIFLANDLCSEDVFIVSSDDPQTPYLNQETREPIPLDSFKNKQLASIYINLLAERGTLPNDISLAAFVDEKGIELVPFGTMLTATDMYWTSLKLEQFDLESLKMIRNVMPMWGDEAMMIALRFAQMPLTQDLGDPLVVFTTAQKILNQLKLPTGVSIEVIGQSDFLYPMALHTAAQGLRQEKRSRAFAVTGGKTYQWTIEELQQEKDITKLLSATSHNPVSWQRDPEAGIDSRIIVRQP